VEAPGQKWTEGSDVKFIKADGTSFLPAGVCEEFSFRLGELQFSVKAYIVDPHVWFFLFFFLSEIGSAVAMSCLGLGVLIFVGMQYSIESAFRIV
jgi:hypothetical protein